MRRSAVVLAIAILLSAAPALAGVTDELRMGKIPLYPGARPHAFKNNQAIATVGASLVQVLEFYRKALVREGWHSTLPDDVLNQELDMVPLALLLYERGATRLRIVVAAKEGKTTIWWGEEHGQPAR